MSGAVDESMDITTDPARWPFDHQRARERAAQVAHPEPIPIGSHRSRGVWLGRTEGGPWPVHIHTYARKASRLT